LLVERESSIGGKMIALSKTFPTLDCSSCITTPKMSAAFHHPRIEILISTEVERIEPRDGSHWVHLRKKPTYVDNSLCIGCRLCEYACPVEYPDPFEEGLGAQRAIAVPFTNALPQKAVLDPGHCLACGACIKACPTDAIQFDQREERVTVEAGAVVLATGFGLNGLELKPQYSVAKSRNIISPMQLERLLAPRGPYGRVLRPSDGKVPSSVAFVLCAGSRDESIGVSYCSRICCMYSIKEAMLLSGALPIADITIYYMDIRAFGKGHEQFHQNAKAMGINFVKAKVARIEPADHDDLSLRVELEEDGGRVDERHHDLVVLAQGAIPVLDPAKVLGVPAAADGFLNQPDLVRVTQTDVEGVFAAGAALGPKDIVDSILEAGAAAMEAARFLSARTRVPVTRPEVTHNALTPA
jgi:heterodisulfide reductase subunit A